MKQPGHWVVWLTTLLIAASLVALPREGAAKGPFLDGVPPIIDEGEPDGPPPAPVRVSKQPLTWSISLRFEYGRLLVLVVPWRGVPASEVIRAAPSKNRAK
jgi:hypothetical protein